MIPYQIKYENHQGQSLWLDDGRYFININDLRNFRWDYSVNNRPGSFGGRVTRFTRGVTERSARIGVRGFTEAEFANRVERLHALTEVDILANKPGRLWLKGEYIRCYLAVSSDLGTYSRRGNFAQKEMTVLITQPFWCREQQYRFKGEEAQAIEEGKKYLGRNPYRYGTRYQSSSFTNEHYAPCPALIVFDTPCDNPSAYIGGKGYTVHTTVKEGEKVTINQLDKTVTHLSADGRETNIFNLRDKEADVFSYIQPGMQDVVFLNDFSLILIEQRSEPPVELIHADAARREIATVRDMLSFDAEISARNDAGEAGNSWQLQMGADVWEKKPIYKGHYLYIDGSEWGGPVEKIRHNTRDGVITLSGCTWRGMMGRKVLCPPEGKAYLEFRAVPVQKMLKAAVLPQLGELFAIGEKQADTELDASFRYEPMLRGLQRVLGEYGLGVDVSYCNQKRMAEIQTRQLLDYSESIDLSQDYGMDIKTESGSLQGYNHLIALGRGELTERTVIHLFRMPDGSVTRMRPDWSGTLSERSIVYDYSNAETEEELLKGALDKLREYAQEDSLEMDASELDIPAKLGDIVGARDRVTGMAGKAPITGMILKMGRDGVTIEKRVG